VIDSEFASSRLDPSGAELAEILRAVSAYLESFLDGLADRPLSDRSGLEAVLADHAVRQSPPEAGRALADLLEVIERASRPGFTVPSPGYLAFIPGGGLVTSAVGDLIAGVLNRYTGLAFPAPGLVALEADVLRWLGDLVGMPPSCVGVLTTGASLATLSALVAARHDRLGEQFSDGVLYVTDQTHLACGRAARVIGLPESGIRLVGTDDHERMDVTALEAAIAEDRARGRRPWCVIGSAGTTNSGVIDPLGTLADVAAREGLWFHVDAAYGGAFALTERGRTRLAGIERADSVVLDMHKGFFLPFGTGCLLVRDETILRESHASGAAPYLASVSALGDELPDFASYTPELSREYRGLRLWLPLHLHGVGAFRSALDEKLDLAELVYAELHADPHLLVLAPPALATVAFRMAGADDATDELTTELMHRVNDEQRVFLSGTHFAGRFWARICVLNHRTHEARVREALEAISRHAAALVNRAV
jgi:aromatic-L-amino-acid decarboxylase